MRLLYLALSFALYAQLSEWCNVASFTVRTRPPRLSIMTKYPRGLLGNVETANARKRWRYRSSPLKAQNVELNELAYAPPKYLLDVVNQNKERRITIADVAVAAGTELTAAKNDLMALATAVGAVLEVTEDGEILFSFPDDYNQRLIKNSILRRLQLIYDKAYPPLFYAFRTSFGVMLIVSLTALTTALFVVASSGSTSDAVRDSNRSNNDSDSRDRDNHNYGRRRSSPNVSINFFLNLSDVLDVLSYTQYRSRLEASMLGQQQRPLNFLEACFSYLFGDGNPNQGHSQQLAQSAAQVIRQNEGLVIAEQLAPFVDAPPPLPPLPQTSSTAAAVNEDSVVVDESYVLPLALKFNGSPSVTDDGHIVYDFQDLTQSARPTTKPTQPALGTTIELQEAALEKPLSFSSATASQQVTAAGLGVANLAAALCLRGSLAQMAVRGSLYSSPYLMALYRVFPFLMGYAVLYNVIPLARYFWTQKENANIAERNSRRTAWFNRLRTDTAVKDKWLEKERSRAHSDAARRTGSSSKQDPDKPKILFNTADSPALEP